MCVDDLLDRKRCALPRYVMAHSNGYEQLAGRKIAVHGAVSTRMDKTRELTRMIVS